MSVIDSETRMSHLDLANDVRLGRARLKAEIRLGERTAASVLLEERAETHRCTVMELLCAQPRWGTTRARKFLSRQGIGEMKFVGSLTVRQRRVLASELGRTRPGCL